MIKQLLLAWAERMREEESERAKKLADAFKEAEAFVLDSIVGDACIHKSRSPYCDDCPIGSFAGELSYEASRIICTRSRHYSK